VENGHDSKLYWELENYTRKNYSVDANFSGALVVSRLDIVCRVRGMVFSATFNNISVTLYIVEVSFIGGVPGETTDLSQVTV